MRTLHLQQGSDLWLAERAKYRTASEASIIMGTGKITRAELLRLKSTGNEQEFSTWVREVLFARGHEIEEAARPIAEEIIGEELYPVTGVCDDDYLLASFDGLTMGDDIAWECKQWNEDKATMVRSGHVPAADYWQVVQQLMVSGASMALYMVTDGTPEKTVHCWLKAEDITRDRTALYDHWRQFDADLAAYVPAEVVPEPVGRAPEDLPALRLEVTGEVTASNLQAFTEHALGVFAEIKTDLSSDTDFANAEKTVKWCKSVEDKLEAAKKQALEQTASIDELFRAIDAIKGEARTKRLELDRLVKSRKETLRNEIINDARGELAACILEHTEGLALEGVRMPVIDADFAGVMKGKRAIQSLRDAVDAELARAKVEAGQVAARINANLKWFSAGYFAEHGGLFPDIGTLANQEAEPFQALVQQRVREETDRQQRAQEQAEKLRQAREAAPPPSGDALSGKRATAVVIDDAPAPAAQATTEPGTGRPTDSQILDVLSRHFGVSHRTVRTWLADFTMEIV